MEPEASLPQSQVPAICPYPEPARKVLNRYSNSGHEVSATVIFVAYLLIFLVTEIKRYLYSCVANVFISRLTVSPVVLACVKMRTSLERLLPVLNERAGSSVGGL